MAARAALSSVVTLNSFQGPSLLTLGSRLRARWVLKQVQDDGIRELVSPFQFDRGPPALGEYDRSKVEA